MKYELAKLFYINNRIESDIYSENKTVPRKKLVDIRSRVLNDFNKYMQVVMKKDKQFNFANYYKKSPFSDESITIKILLHLYKSFGHLRRLLKQHTTFQMFLNLRLIIPHQIVESFPIR